MSDRYEFISPTWCEVDSIDPENLTDCQEDEYSDEFVIDLSGPSLILGDPNSTALVVTADDMEGLLTFSKRIHAAIVELQHRIANNEHA